ncbi:MAG: 3-deoxy-manno-octulosonate cytidylyltransferase [Candidatus Zixiibacteriota bacterium]|nr:MAG: 3-deoxy-manno-octulosonate cytidylyltransferase [candidate division Zixibacteria bacterium]
MQTDVVAVIPARMGSSRFPGKLLHPHQGKPLLYHIWNRVRKTRLIDRLLIATDSPEIAETAVSFGAEVVITSGHHRTGSDRVAEAVRGRRCRIVINVQGDTYGLSTATLDRVIKVMSADSRIRFATLARRIADDEELFDPGVVKIVTAADGKALWFSRFPLPYLQQPAAGVRARQFKYLAHIGVYFFRWQALEKYTSWKRSPLEKAESLEQLRILENGGCMKVFRTNARTISIDKPSDLKKTTGCCR